MPTDIRLCSECRNIDFESLFYVPDPNHDPDAANTLGFYEDDGTRHWWTTYNDIPLGSIPSVASRHSSCDFCAFVLEVACLSFEGGPIRRVHHSDSDSDENDAETTSRGSSPVLSTSEISDAMIPARKTTRFRVSVLPLWKHSDG